MQFGNRLFFAVPHSPILTSNLVQVSNHWNQCFLWWNLNLKSCSRLHLWIQTTLVLCSSKRVAKVLQPFTQICVLHEVETTNIHVHSLDFSNSAAGDNCDIRRLCMGKEDLGQHQLHSHHTKLHLTWSNSHKTSQMHVNFLEFSH